MTSLTQWTWVQSLEIVKDRKAQHAAVHGVTKSRTWLRAWTTTGDRVNKVKKHLNTCDAWKRETALHPVIPRPPLSSFFSSCLTFSSFSIHLSSFPTFLHFFLNVQLIDTLLETMWGFGNANWLIKTFIWFLVNVGKAMYLLLNYFCLHF